MYEECYGVSNDVLNDVFLCCVLERDDVKPQDHCSVLLEETAFGANASLQRSDPCSTHFF